MKNSSNVKEAIIKATTELIQQSSGNIADITTRAIAVKAGVGIGLINYHFQSKDNLITICVQRIIRKVIFSFSVNTPDDQSDKERLTDWAIRVFDFLFENAAISRISILGDLYNYTIDSNSVKTQKGFMLAMGNDMQASEKEMLSFTLVAAMQTAFLSSSTMPELLGYDFNNRPDRNLFITRLVSSLFNKIEKKEEFNKIE